MDYPRRYGNYGIGGGSYLNSGDRGRYDYMSLGRFPGLFGDSLNFESAMDSLIQRGRYGGSMGYGSGGDGQRRTWSLEARNPASAMRNQGPKRTQPAPVVNERFENPRRPNTRSAASRPAVSSAPTAAKVVKVEVANLKSLLKLHGNKGAVIGLANVEEIIIEADGSITYAYDCNLCEKKKLTPQKMLEHLITADHRKNYIKDKGLEEVEDKDLPKRALAIEQVHGRGEWTVRHETRGLKTIDKSAFLKKGSKKKAKDVEMTDVGDPQLRDGDVVVDELTSAQVAESLDPKLVVLHYFDQLLTKNFSIESEPEATVVNSIIQKLDGALLAYSEKTGTVVEEAGNGVSQSDENIPPESAAEAPMESA